MDFLIDLQSISRMFGSFQALCNIDLQLEPGRIGLLGPNGAGKSTLLKILLGLLSPTSGHGRILDQTIQPGAHEGNTQLRRLIGYMPESDSLIPGLTGIEYVALAGELYGMPRKQAERRAHEMLTYLEMEDARYRLLEEYSTGMKQRIKLAQAIVHDPPVLLLDEPTSGLDPSGREAMLNLLLELGRDFGKSLILSTHLLADVEVVCEKVVILLNGQIRGQGAVADLRMQRQHRYRLQFQGENNGFCEDLRLEGVQILSQNEKGEMRVRVPSQWPVRKFFILADQHDLLLRGIEPDEESLEELFIRMVHRETTLTN